MIVRRASKRHLALLTWAPAAWVSVCLVSCTPAIYQKVDVSLRQGNPAAAEKHLLSYLRTHPGDARAYFRLAEIQALLGKWSEVAANLDRCAELDQGWKRDAEAARERYWRTNLNRGIESLANQELRRAALYFRHATTLLPTRPLAHRLLGEAHVRLDDTNQAVTAFERAVQLDPAEPTAHRYLARIFFTRGEYQKALEHAQAILKIQVGDLEAMRLVAYSYDHLDETQSALTAYLSLVNRSRDPADLEAFAALQYRLGNYEQAIGWARKAMSLNGDRLRNLRAIAQCHLLRKDFNELEKTAHEILGVKPEDVAALQLLQVAYTALNKEQERIEITERIKQITVK